MKCVLTLIHRFICCVSGETDYTFRLFSNVRIYNACWRSKLMKKGLWLEKEGKFLKQVYLCNILRNKLKKMTSSEPIVHIAPRLDRKKRNKGKYWRTEIIMNNKRVHWKGKTQTLLQHQQTYDQRLCFLHFSASLLALLQPSYQCFSHPSWSCPTSWVDSCCARSELGK